MALLFQTTFQSSSTIVDSFHLLFIKYFTFLRVYWNCYRPLSNNNFLGISGYRTSGWIWYISSLFRSWTWQEWLFSSTWLRSFYLILFTPRRRHFQILHLSNYFHDLVRLTLQWPCNCWILYKEEEGEASVSDFFEMFFLFLHGEHFESPRGVLRQVAPELTPTEYSVGHDRDRFRIWTFAYFPVVLFKITQRMDDSRGVTYAHDVLASLPPIHTIARFCARNHQCNKLKRRILGRYVDPRTSIFFAWCNFLKS